MPITAIFQPYVRVKNASEFSNTRNTDLLIVMAIISIFASCSNAAKPQGAPTIKGKKYYISNDGNDSNNGSEQSPFKSIAKLNAMKLQAGDAVLFKAGETFNGNVSLTLEGVSGDSVYLSSYGDGRALINAGDSIGLSIGGKYFRISRLDVKGSGRKNGNTATGIQLIEAAHAVVDDIHVQGFQKSGIGLWNCTYVTLDRISAEQNGFAGIYVEGNNKKNSRNIIIRNSSATNNPGDPTNLSNHSGNGILVGLSTNVLIERCTASGNGWDMPRVGNGPVGIWGYECDSLTIQYCISYRNKTQKGAKDGGGFDFDGGITNSVMQYNLSYENEGAGYGLFQYHGASPWYNNIMRYNLSINDAQKTEGSGGIFVWSNDPDSNHLSKCYIYNNVVYSMVRPAVEFEPESRNTQFFFSNNIFIGRGNLINGPSSGERFIGNVWWSPDGQATFRNFSTVQEWAEKSGQERLAGKVIGLQLDPLLKGPLTASITDPFSFDQLTGFQLQPSSPVKDRGVNVAAMFGINEARTDLYGNNIPSGSPVDPGVHELPDNN